MTGHETGSNPLEDASFLDERIDGIIQEYIGALTRTDLKQEFRDLKRDQAIDRICWELTPDPATFNRAVNLRSLGALRVLDIDLRQGKEEKGFHVAVFDNPFWQAVDNGMVSYLKKFGHELPSDVSDEPVWEPVETLSGLGKMSTEPIAMLSDHVVYRVAVFAPGYDGPEHDKPVAVHFEGRRA